MVEGLLRWIARVVLRALCERAKRDVGGREYEYQLIKVKCYKLCALSEK